MPIEKWRNYFIDHGNGHVTAYGADKEEALRHVGHGEQLHFEWQYAIVCDGDREWGTCGQNDFDGCSDGRAAVMRQAMANGWEMIGGKWLCPDCVEELKKRDNVQMGVQNDVRLSERR